VVLLAVAAVLDFADDNVVVGICFAVATVLLAFNALRSRQGSRPDETQAD